MLILLLSVFPPLRDAPSFSFGNIRRDRRESLSITYQNLYSLSELQTVRIKWNLDDYGIAVSHFGSELYREIKLSGNGFFTGENIYLSISPSLLYLAQKDGIYTGANLDLETGLTWNSYNLYVRAAHIISYIRGDVIPLEFELGSFYNDRWNSIGFRICFEENWGFVLGFGYMLKMGLFNAGIGLITNPYIPTAGFSIELQNIRFSAGFQNHPVLGFSETFTIYYGI